jgi:glycerol-3-phosphate acyltransferase PlsY
MNYFVIIIVGLCAYLLGSIPSGYVLVKMFRNEDIREYGSGNIGATNVARSGAKGLGLLTLLLDTGKGIAAVMLARVVGSHMGLSHGDFSLLLAVSAVLAMVGHIFPVWLRFRGGKGVATGMGVTFALVPLAALCALVIFILVFALSRYVSLSSMIAAASLPVLAYFIYRGIDMVVLAATATASLLIVVKHHENVGRLMAGTEKKFGVKEA